jgi:hypothetical protein
MIAFAILDYEYEGEFRKDFYKYFLSFSTPEKDFYEVQSHVIKEDYVGLVDLEKISQMTCVQKEHLLFTACNFGSIRSLEKLITLFPNHDQYVCEQLSKAASSFRKLPVFKILLAKYGMCPVCEGNFLVSAVINEDINFSLREARRA